MGYQRLGLSHQVRKAETVLGTTVFERGARKVTPTDAGGDILRRIGMLLQQVAALVHETSRKGGGIRRAPPRRDDLYCRPIPHSSNGWVRSQTLSAS